MVFTMLESMVGRSQAQVLNPLIGRTITDTLENLCQCLDKLGLSLSTQHEDNSISFFCSSVSAALKFEAGQLLGQVTLAARTDPPARPASSSG
ncbi:hypothetical protein EV683_10521 [Crenobacter luteus]|nr:hypothetical protein EV683_10521 [Crenobacter luteus]